MVSLLAVLEPQGDGKDSSTNRLLVSHPPGAFLLWGGKSRRQILQAGWLLECRTAQGPLVPAAGP